MNSRNIPKNNQTKKFEKIKSNFIFKNHGLMKRKITKKIK